MEHELFQSKLRPSVDAALLSEMIRSSSSGEHRHRVAAMELIFEWSIQGRHRRMVTHAKQALRPDPAPQPTEGSKDALDILIPVQSPAPTPPQQPPSHSPPNSTGASLPAGPASAPVEPEGLPKPSSLWERKKKKKGVQHRPEPPTNVGVNPPPPEDTVEFVCRRCNIKQPRGRLWLGIHCGLCGSNVNCVGCGTPYLYQTSEACTSCCRKFKQ